MKHVIRDYLSVTKKEWNGMVVLMVLIVLVLIIPTIATRLYHDPVLDTREFNEAVSRLGENKTKGLVAKYSADDFTGNPDEKEQNPVMVHFDPNNLPLSRWLKLGLSARQARVIKNYESKGGRFTSKEDVKKMYALTADDYIRLEPYITLPNTVLKNAKTDEIIELNGADSAKLTTVRGIGPSFAARIMDYKKQLGGFYKKEQLKEVFGIDSTKYASLKDEVSIDNRKIKRIDINKVTVDDLRKFPYLNFKQMNAIVEYRKQHGNYHSVGDLKNIAIIDGPLLDKMIPYLSFK